MIPDQISDQRSLLFLKARPRTHRTRPSRSTLPRAWADRIGTLFVDHELLVLLALLAVLLVRAIANSRQKPLWFDELYTVFVAIQPTAARFFAALPACGIGPLQPLLVRALLPLFGTSELAVRIPSLIAFLAATAGLYLFVRRECGRLFALAAVLLTLSQPGWAYSFEGRPYAMLLAFMMLGLLSWQSYILPNPTAASRRWALAGIATALILSILSHHIGLVELGLPLLAGEAVRTIRRRRLDIPLLSVAAVSTLVALAFTLPLALRVRRLLLAGSVAYHAALTWRQGIHGDLANANLSLWFIVSGEVLWAAAAIVIAAFLSRTWFLARTQNTSDIPAAPTPTPTPASAAMVRPELIAVAIAAALLIPATMVLTESSAGYYNCRYGIGSIIGVSLAAVFLAWRSDGSTRPIALLTVLFFGGIWLRTTVGEVHHSAPPPPNSAYNDTSTRPLAVTDALTFVPLWWYAPPGIRQRLVYLNNPDDNTVVQICVQSHAPLVGFHVEDLRQFIAANNDFLLLPGRPSPDLQRKIAQAGSTVTPIPGTPYSDVHRPAR